MTLTVSNSRKKQSRIVILFVTLLILISVGVTSYYGVEEKEPTKSAKFWVSLACVCVLLSLVFMYGLFTNFR